MQFTFSILPALLLLLPLVATTPFPQVDTACYDKCVGLADEYCPDTYPESCYCLNDYKTKCAQACPRDGVIPVLDACDKVEVVECYNKCMSQWACIQSWPDSCYCYNEHVKICSSQCGSTPVYQNCTLSAV
ncbi:hypothetical protein DFP73DRAFT_594420 [Morchella snyderi]|nr:hypothetical protein DFP73DRAFT_594420 [Morchella snyderi]